MININDLNEYHEKEKNLMMKVNKLEDEFNDKLNLYWIQECGDDFEKYEKILKYIKKAYDRGDEDSLISMNIEVTSLINRCMNNLVSKRNITDIRLRKDYYNGECVSLYQNGFGYINPVWDSKTKKINDFKTYKYLFSMNVDWREYIYKKSKKEMIGAFQKYIPKWLLLQYHDLSDDIDINEVEILEKDTGFHSDITSLKIRTEHHVSIDLNSYRKRIEIADGFLGGCSINLESQEVTAKECYLLSLIWDDVEKEIKDFIRTIAKNKRNNKKLLSNIKEEISSPLLSEEL